MVTKTNVSPHSRTGCVAASANHLGIYGLMLPVENLGPAAQLGPVDEIRKQDVIAMCNVRDSMNQLYSHRGRTPDFPQVHNPMFNPDIEFGYNDHGQALTIDAQQTLEKPPGVPSIIKIGQPAQPPQWTQLNTQNMQMWNMQQQPTTQGVQQQPTPMITA
eukprot:4921024-Amphidinium_carterae.1